MSNFTLKTLCVVLSFIVISLLFFLEYRNYGVYYETQRLMADYAFKATMKLEKIDEVIEILQTQINQLRPEAE